MKATLRLDWFLLLAGCQVYVLSVQNSRCFVNLHVRRAIYVFSAL